MNKNEKMQLQSNLAEKLDKAGMVVLAEYRGLTVEELSNLRVELRKSEAEFKIAKNRILKRAIDDGRDKYSALSDELKGPTGTVFVYGDVAQATKTVLEFAKDHEKLVVKKGILEGNAVGENDLKAIADLPSKEVMLGQIVGSLISPHRGLVTTLSGVSRNLVQVINAIKEKKAQAEGSA